MPTKKAEACLMARYIGPKHRLCRREGMPLCGKGNCPQLTRPAPPGMHGSRGTRRRPSSYGLQLREKQKAKRIYGVLERQFKRYVQDCMRKRGETGIAILQTLEGRLDNVLYRLGLALSRPMARQLVSHRHILVDGKRVNIPSYGVKPGQTVQLDTKIAKIPSIVEFMNTKKPEEIPSWLERKATVGRVVRFPAREEIDGSINEQLIVEYYSR